MDKSSSIAKNIHSYIASRAPEFLKALNRVCIRYYNKDCITLLLEEPEKLRDILLKYNDIATAKFVIKNLFLKPLLEKLDRDKEKLLEDLSSNFIEDSEVFKRKLQDVLRYRD